MTNTERQINVEKGSRKFNGDKRKFINMVISFDKITLDDSLSKIYQSILRDNREFSQTIKEVLNLQQSAETIDAIGLSKSCEDFYRHLITLKNVKDATFHALIVFDHLLLRVIEFKEELKQISGNHAQEGNLTAREIQQDVRATLSNYNTEQQKNSRLIAYNQENDRIIQDNYNDKNGPQNNFRNSVQKPHISKQSAKSQQQQQPTYILRNSHYSPKNSYVVHSEQVQNDKYGGSHMLVDQQNQNYTYFMSLNKQRNGEHKSDENLRIAGLSSLQQNDTQFAEQIILEKEAKQDGCTCNIF